MFVKDMYVITIMRRKTRIMGMTTTDLYVKLISLENIIRLSTPPVHHCPGGGIPVTRVSNRLWEVDKRI